MKTSDIFGVIDNLEKKILSTESLGTKRAKYTEDLDKIKKEYQQVEVPENLKEVYVSLVKKGKELPNHFKVNSNPKELSRKIEYYMRYLKAALGDFNGRTPEVMKYYRAYLFTSILFLALSPMWYGFILPGIFFVPIFLGTRGVKNRTRTGFMMSLAVVPVALMTASLWVKNGLYVMGNYQQAIQSALDEGKRSMLTTKLMVIGLPSMGAMLMVFAILMLYKGYKSRDLFV